MSRKHRAVYGIAFAAILVAVMVWAGVFVVNADTEKWTDHADTAWYNSDYVTFTIDTPAKLAGAAKLVNSGTVDGFRNKILEVDRNLDLAAYEWVPIGTDQYPFHGALVSKNNAVFEIRGMKLSGNLTYAGLVGYMDNGTVKGFKFMNSGKIEVGSSNVTGIVYVMQSVTSQTYGTVWELVPVPDTRVGYVGSAVGKMVNNSMVHSVTNLIPIKSDFAAKHVYAGGIVGGGEGSISDSHNLAPIAAKGPDIEAGGIIGYGESGGLVIKKTSNQAAVQADSSGAAHAAGIIGHAAGRLSLGDENTPFSNTGSIQVSNARLAYAAGIVGRAGAAVDFSDATSNAGAVTIQSAAAEASYASALVGSIDTEQANPQFSIAFTNTAPVTNNGGTNVHTGVLAGYVNSTFAWGKGFTNPAPVSASGQQQVFTGGLIGKVSGNASFAGIARNNGAILVGAGAPAPNEAFTGGIIGYAGQRVLFDSTANQAYVNGGEITVSGGTGVYTGGIVGNKAYARTSGETISNVSNTAPIRVSGQSKIYTGGLIGVVPEEGVDKVITGAFFDKEITVTAASSELGRTVSTGGIVGYYVNHSDNRAAIDLASFRGKITSTGGGNESFTGGIAGYVDGGTIKRASIGNTAANFAKLSSDGNAGGVVGYMNGNVETAGVKLTTIVLQTAGGISGGVAGKAQGAITAATVGDETFTEGYSVRLEAAARDAAGGKDNVTLGGIVGANTNTFSLTNSHASHIGLITAAGRSGYTLGALAGSLTAGAQIGNVEAPVTADHILIDLKAAGSQVGGAIGYNRSAKVYVKADQITFNVQGAQAKAGGVIGIQDVAAGSIPAADGAGAAGFALKANQLTFTTQGAGASVGGVFGENLGDTPRVSASSIMITSSGADSRLGGIAGTNRGILMESSASLIGITTSGAGAEAGGIAGRSDIADGGLAAARIVRPQVHTEEAALISSMGERSWVGGIVGSAKLTEIVNPRIEAVIPNYVTMTAGAAQNGVGGLVGRIELGKLLGDSAFVHVENLLITGGQSATSSYLGGIAAYQDQAAMDKLTVKSANLVVNGAQSVVGGMAGYNRSSASAVISNNFIDGLNIKVNATAAQATVGGFVGVNDKQDTDPAASPAAGVSSIQNSRYVGSVQVASPSSVTGGMVGENRSLIANNSISDKIPVSSKGSGGIIGGLAGINTATGTLYYAYSNSTLAVEGEGTLAGGFVGDNRGKVIASYVDIDVNGYAHGATGSPVYLGGLAGRNTGTIDKSHSVSKVTAYGSHSRVGGLVGDQAGGNIMNSYTGNIVTAMGNDSFSGGFLGRITSGQVSTVYSAAHVLAENGAYAGGFAGRYDNASKELLYKAYYVKDETLAINKDLPDFADGNHRWLQVHARLSTLLSSTLMDRASFPGLSGWDFTNTWKYGSVNAEYKYPELQRSANTGGDGGSGNEVNANIAWYMRDKAAFTFDIKTEAELAGLAALVNGTVTGVERFDFEGRTIRLLNPIHIQSKQWMPIGRSEDTTFQGSFDGGHYLIDGLSVQPNHSNSGLFGVIGAKAKVTNMVMEPLSIAGIQNTGVLAGYNKGQVSNIKIKVLPNLTISGGTVGSLFGKNTGTFQNVSLALESGSKLEAVGADAVAGGLIGDNTGALTQGLFSFTSSGAVLSSSSERATLGGLVGKQSGAISGLDRSMDYSLAAYGPESVLGGLIGQHVSGQTDRVTLTYTTGSITAAGSGSTVGGMTGQSEAGNPMSQVTVTASGAGQQLTAEGTVGGLVGRKTGNWTNSFDMDQVKVEKLLIVTRESSPETTIGGIAGKLAATVMHQAISDVEIRAAGGQVMSGGIVGSGQDSILDQVEAVSNVTFAAKSGESSLGGIAGVMSVAEQDRGKAFDFGRRAPLYPGIYEASVHGKPLIAQGVDNGSDLQLGGIVGKLEHASVYYAKTNVDLEVRGGKAAAAGGIAGVSSGNIVSSRPLQSITASTSVVYDVGGVVGRSTGGEIHYTSASSPDGQTLTVGRTAAKQGAVPAVHAGGLIGRGDNTKITNAYASMPVKVADDNQDSTLYAGGFAGLLGDGNLGSSTMERVYALGSVEAQGIIGSYAGGFAGSIDRYTITDAYAAGRVANTGYDTGSGGFAGAVERGAVIRHSYASQDSLTTTGVNQSTRSYTGGFAGFNDGTLDEVFARTGALAVNVSGANIYKGALVGYNFRDGKVTSSWHTAAMNPIGYSLGAAAGNAQGDVSASFDGFTDWNFEREAAFLNSKNGSDWNILNGRQLAGLVWLHNQDTGLAYYQLFDRTAAQKPAISKILLGADLDMEGKPWTPFDSFTSELDGQGYTIKGLKIAAGAADQQGFISQNRGKVARLGIIEAQVSAGSRSGIVTGINHAEGSLNGIEVSGQMQGRDFVGGLVGENKGSIRQVNLHDLKVDGTAYVGGVAGTNNGSIGSSVVKAAVSGTDSFVGGIAGLNEAELTEVEVQGSVQGAEHVGGAAGENKQGLHAITGKELTVQGVTRIGGLAGTNSGLINGSNVQITVTGTGERIGGIAGVNDGELNQVEVQGSVKGAGNVGGAAGINANKLTAVAVRSLQVDGGMGVGGLAGLNSGSIEGSSSIAAVTAAGSYAGGIAGANEGTVKQTYAAGSVKADAGRDIAAAGGIAGSLTASGSIEQSFSYADVQATGAHAEAGGIAGVSSGSIRDVYASGRVEAQGQAAAKSGGIAGFAVAGTIRGALAYGEVRSVIDGKIHRGKTLYGGIAGQKAAEAKVTGSLFNKQALKNDSAYYDEDGKRVSGAEAGAGATGLNTKQLTQSVLPDGLDSKVWGAAQGYFPALQAFGGSAASKLSTAAVTLVDHDLMSQIGSRFGLTSDPALHWQAGAAIHIVRDSAGIVNGTLKSTGSAELSVTAGGESRTIVLNAPSSPYAAAVPMPKVISGSQTFDNKVDVTLAVDEPDASIYYTLDGSQPSANSLRYTAPISLTATTTIKAVAIAEDMETSQVLSGTWTKRTVSGGGWGGGGIFVAPPVIEAAIGDGKIVIEASAPAKVARNSILKLTAPEGQVIYYTTDGSAPTKKSKVYKEGDIVITGNMTIKAITDKDDRVLTINYEVENAKYAVKKDAHEIKYAAGYDNHEFKPDAAITRYELLDALSPLLDKEKVSVDTVLKGVDAASKANVAFFASAGIIDGYEDGTFGGERGLTRAEFVAMMSRVLKLDVRAQGETFLTDVAGHWSEWYVNAFTKAGYVDGFPDGSFKPDSEISRAQAIVVINRIIWAKKKESPARFSDLTPEHWAFEDIMAAAK
ncbi:chitobiase/beta-hexosaminidase C-terminal domain-containing protein [Paenibacillus puerhi]|uniref:chitobiase/beta-hexosaminidase C-terminal domain-containing protein n=1 Tax=Paenibacillus puerhi TaxID=2692622 RepID=UPI001356A126|nr:chitobiase/beta-hexosaminidase C-terminal domain-containing protein [Paenibacillus puerhi]